MSTSLKYERLARLHAIGDDDRIDPSLAEVRRRPEPRRILTPDMQPVVDVEAVLVAEVERLESRLEVARDDLRRFRLSHDHAEAPRCPTRR